MQKWKLSKFKNWMSTGLVQYDGKVFVLRNYDSKANKAVMI